MAQGDKWEISFAVPVPNYRFTEWPPTVTDGPIGWWLDSGMAADLRSGGQAAQSYVHLTQSAQYKYIKTTLPARSLPSFEARYRIVYAYKSSEGVYWRFIWRDSGGGLVGSSWDTYGAAAASWTVATGAALKSGVSGASVWLTLFAVSGTLELSEVAVGWTPADWGGSAYETLDSYPEPDGVYYGPISGGGVIRKASGFGVPETATGRPEKWALRAYYSHLKEADYLKIQRYYMGSVGMLDGYPRPVMVRPYLLDQSTVTGPEVIVGRFAGKPTFERTGGLANYYSGELVIEEL